MLAFHALQVELFHAKTISKESTHSSLKTFKDIYKSMDKNKQIFFQFLEARIPVRWKSQELLGGVKENYAVAVLETSCGRVDLGL